MTASAGRAIASATYPAVSSVTKNSGAVDFRHMIPWARSHVGSLASRVRRRDPMSLCASSRAGSRTRWRPDAGAHSMAEERVEGRVVAIRGAVIDLAFEGGPPPIEDAVEILDSDGRVVVAEIQAHLDAHSARAIALEPTTGLRRGDAARAAGGPVAVAGRRGDARAPHGRARPRSATAAPRCRPTRRAGRSTASRRRSPPRPGRRSSSPPASR